MITKATIDTIFETVRVEEVIGDFVSLKKSGSNYKGLSPFVTEKTPSFMVSPAKQIWKDFSSGKGGNAVSFLMEHEHFSYPEALRYLAKKYNIEVEETEQTHEEKELQTEKESLFIVSEFANKYFQHMLTHTDEGRSVGLSYFKERGFSATTIEKFQLGYSPGAFDAFSNEALVKGYQVEYLEKTGLSIVRDNKKLMDRFRGRVMFPIHSMSGRILGFGGRILTNDKKVAKYLNSPESDIYHKSKVLYGIFHAKQAIAKEDNCFLVEGYTDVIQMHQAGIENVVSSSGTALTSDQIRLIQRLTKNITVLFDGDDAGLRASLRGIDLILEAGMNVRVCTFPDGDDPDSFAKKTSIDELREYLQENAMDFIRFKASLLISDAQNDPIKKAEHIRDIVQSINKVQDVIQREIYVQECARIMDVSEEVLFSALAQMGKKETEEANKKFKQQKAMQVVSSQSQPDLQPEKVDVLYLLERNLIKILLLYADVEEKIDDLAININEDEEVIYEPVKVYRKVIDHIYINIHDDELGMATPVFKQMYEDIIEYYRRHQAWNLEDYLIQVKPELVQEITAIIMEEEKYNIHDWQSQNIFVKSKENGIAQYVKETVLSIRWYYINALINTLKESLAGSIQADRLNVLQDVVEYNKLTLLLSHNLGRVMYRF